MTTSDDIKALAEQYAQEAYNTGKSEQKAADAQALSDLQAQFDAYKASHPDTTPPPPPPPPSGPILGMNLGHPSTVYGPNAKYEPKAKIGRVYTPTGCTSLSSVSEFERGMDLGIRTYHVSWKDTSTSNVQKMLTSKPSGVKIYGTHHHEPEDDTASVSIATWKSRQQTMMPAVRAAGCIPTVCFMAWTLQSASGRKISDWSLPKGLVDAVAWDFYPAKVDIVAGVVSSMKSASSQYFGTTRNLIGEFGAANTDPNGVKIIEALKAATTDFEALQYWSSQVDSSATNWRFNDQTAAAWYK